MKTNNHQVPPVASTDESSSFDPREYLRPILVYKWVVLGIAVVVSVATVFFTLRQPKIFQATCTIEYDPNPPRPLGRDIEDVADPVGSFWSAREFFETQNRVIASRSVSERVVRKLGLHHDASFFYLDGDAKKAFRGETVEETASVLQSRLSVEQERDTRIVYIRVVDRDPARAQVLANALADAYVDKTLEDRLGSAVAAIEWLTSQLDELKRKLERSELALHEFKKENDILAVSMEDRQSGVTARVEQISAELTTVQMRRIALAARLAELTRAQASAEPLMAHAPMIDSNEKINALRAEFSAKEAERETLRTRYGVSHPKIEELDVQLATLRTQLRREIEGVVASARAELNEANSVAAGLRAELAAEVAKGHELASHDTKYAALNRERENNSKLLDTLLQRTTQTDLTRAQRVTHVRIVDRATKPETPVSPKVQVNVASGAIAGILIGLGFAVLLGRMDRRIKNVENVEALGLTALGILPVIEEGAKAARSAARRSRKRLTQTGPEPVKRDLIVHSHPMSSAAECFRTVRTNLTFMSTAGMFRSLVVTSSSPREGKTTVATNLAIALAQSGKRVLLVDTDLRRPRIHRTFSLPSGKGMTTVLVGDAHLLDTVMNSVVPGLSILPCGPVPPNPAELLHTDRFQELLETAKAHFDIVLFDSPPLAAVTDAAILAPQVDAALLVVRADHTTRDAVRSALRQLQDVGANIAGAVLNGVDFSDGASRYGGAYYQYYYRQQGYYADTDDTRDSSSAAAE